MIQFLHDYSNSLNIKAKLEYLFPALQTTSCNTEFFNYEAYECLGDTLMLVVVATILYLKGYDEAEIIIRKGRWLVIIIGLRWSLDWKFIGVLKLVILRVKSGCHPLKIRMLFLRRIGII